MLEPFLGFIHGEVNKVCYQNWILDNLDERIHVRILVQRDPTRTSNSPFGCLQLTSHFPTHPPPRTKGCQKEDGRSYKALMSFPPDTQGSFCGSWIYVCMRFRSINQHIAPSQKMSDSNSTCCYARTVTSNNIQLGTLVSERFEMIEIQIICCFLNDGMIIQQTNFHGSISINATI